MPIDEATMIEQLKGKQKNVRRPLSVNIDSGSEINPDKKDLTTNAKVRKNKSSTVGRKPTNNETVQFRCPSSNLEALQKKINRLNSKGLGLDTKEVMALLVSHAAQLHSSEFHELIIAERLRS